MELSSCATALTAAASQAATVLNKIHTITDTDTDIDIDTHRHTYIDLHIK